VCLNTVMATGVMNWNLGEADRMGGAERSGVDGIDSVTVVSFLPFQVNFSVTG
jgi:hypothetical protein